MATPRSEDAQTPSPADARWRAIGITAEAMGELMEFWNFKPSMGRIWAILYLSAESLDAEQIEARTGLSAGMVSNSVNELVQWGVIRRVPSPGERRRQFAAETDIWACIARVFRQRELRLVTRTVSHLEEALRILDEEGKSSDPKAMLESRFLATRVRNLLDLTRTGQHLVERFARTGSANLRPIRDVLLSRRG